MAGVHSVMSGLASASTAARHSPRVAQRRKAHGQPHGQISRYQEFPQTEWQDTTACRGIQTNQDSYLQISFEPTMQTLTILTCYKRNILKILSENEKYFLS
jgi:hypothetical protein